MNDESLKQQLRTWKAEASLPADFQREVWQRIAERGEARSTTSFATFFETWLGWALRPMAAVALAVVAVAAGVGLGTWKGTTDRAAHWEQLEARYVESIDPYVSTNHLAAR
jgi:hypothetical protein